MNNRRKHLEERLWAAAEQLRANSSLKLNEIQEPILGLIFLNATLSCTLWFFDKSKVGTERQQQVLFINAQDIYTVIDRAHSTWTDEQIQEIANIVRAFRGESGCGKYADIKGRCKVATLEEIAANDYSLNPGRYIEIVAQEMSDVDFTARMQELMGEFTALTEEAHKLEQKIVEDWQRIL